MTSINQIRTNNTFCLIFWEEKNEKKKSYDIETFSIDRILNEEHF